MSLNILLFASVREAMGDDLISLQTETPLSVEQLLSQLAKQYPNLQPHLSSLRVAVNHEYAMAETVINTGDEVALIPPVSGG